MLMHTVLLRGDSETIRSDKMKKCTMSRKKIPNLIALASIIFFFTVFNPSFAANESSKSSIFRYGPQGEKQEQNKISKKVLINFEKDETITFLVKFKDQVNLEPVVDETVKKAKQQEMTSFQTKLRKRSAIVTHLQANAEENQYSVKKYLNKEKNEGHVKKIESFYIVNAMAITATKDVMESLASYPEVDKILPNEKRKIIEPEQVSKPTAKINSDSVEWNIEKVGAPKLWDQGIDGTGVVVANIDTGVDWKHPALQSKYRGYNAADPMNSEHTFSWYDAVHGSTEPVDVNGHGTHTMGIMVGSEPDRNNQIGVAPGAKWMAVRAIDDDGTATDVDLLEAGEWILAPKDAEGNPHPEKSPDIVNNSWGGGSELNDWYRPVVQAWRAADIFPVFSAGNGYASPGSVSQPGNYPESFTVGALDSDNHIAWFSLQGPSPYDEIKPDASAPGVNILSALPNAQYESWDGTSMAAPHIGGIVALVKQTNPSLTVDEIEQMLLSNATELTDEEYTTSPNQAYGYGLVNANNVIHPEENKVAEVKGHVGYVGNDHKKPEFQYERPSIVYRGAPLALTIQAQDDTTLKTVELSYQIDQDKNWKKIKANQTSGDSHTGTFQATIPFTDVKGQTISYEWTITDYLGNKAHSKTYQEDVQQGITRGYKTDFESTPLGWYSFGRFSSWEWSKPLYPYITVPSGEKVYATTANDWSYNNNEFSSLVMPPIDVPAIGSTYLHFKQAYGFPSLFKGIFDYGYVVISTDMKNWERVIENQGHTYLQWENREVDLSGYAGKTIYVGYQLQTDNETNNLGWYLDDVSIDGATIQSANLSRFNSYSTDVSQKKQITKTPNELVNIIIPEQNVDTNKKSKSNFLPLGAQVTIIDTGQAIQTNPVDGSFTLKADEGKYTLRAETYGYSSQNQQATFRNNKVETANFVLQPIPRGTITGQIIDQTTGKPISGATLALVEDAAIKPVVTDKQGRFSLEAYEGTYTLLIRAPFYHTKKVNITISDKETKMNATTLLPFIGYPGEIGYDDGTNEDVILPSLNELAAVKMTLEDGKQEALLTGGLFRVVADYFPPGNANFQAYVYDATGENGGPGNRLAGPIDAQVNPNDPWTLVDLSRYSIFVGKDFYLVYGQPGKFPYISALGTDTNGSIAGRAWSFNGTSWRQMPTSGTGVFDRGNFMIRSIVTYEGQLNN
jgi:bacillopeptidase F